MVDVIFINVGYGDAILIKQEERYGLIDGGSSILGEFQGNRISLQNYLKRESITELDFIIITHIHEDHVCGIAEIINSVKIKKFYLPYIPKIENAEDILLDKTALPNLLAYTKALNSFKNILRYAKHNGINTYDLTQLQSIRPWNNGVEFRVLEPTALAADSYSQRLQAIFKERESTSILENIVALDRDSNDFSLLLKLLYEGQSIVLTADNCPVNWREETFTSLKYENVLKLPHHGQQDAINEEFLTHVNVDYIVTSASNDYRHASSNPWVYQQLKAANPNITFLFTDEFPESEFSQIERSDKQALVIRVANSTVDVIV